MFRAYLDESYSDRVFSIGGYFGSERAWEGFDSEWKDVLDRYSLSVFHASEWESLYGEFQGWSLDKKISCIRELIAVIANHEIIGIHSAISLRDYEQLFPLDSEDSPYFLCFQSCIGEIAIFAGEQQEDVAFIFDQKPEVEYRAMRLFNFAKTHDDWLDRQWLGTITFADKRKFLPLQAADGLAYEGFKHFENEITNSGRAIRKPLDLIRKSKTLYGKPWYREELKWLRGEFKALQQEGKIIRVPLKKGEAR